MLDRLSAWWKNNVIDADPYDGIPGYMDNACPACVMGDVPKNTQPASLGSVLLSPPSVLESLLGKRFPVLDDGFVSLVSVNGNDRTAVEAARLTAGSSGKDDEGLLRYLMRHRHDTPFEFAGFTIHIRVPMDCWRQIVRHRLFSINEYSTRYSEAIDSASITQPEEWRLQSASNRQGSDGHLTEWPEGYPMSQVADSVARRGGTPGEWMSEREKSTQDYARAVYEDAVALGVAKEQARKVLPLSTYTEAWLECDLRGWLHFLSLRMDPHAQSEVRAYGDAIGNEIVSKLFPLTWRAFSDYRLNGMTLSALDIEAMSRMGSGEGYEIVDELFSNKREREEFVSKAKKLFGGKE